LADFPEFVLSTAETSKAISRGVEAKKLRHIGGRLYTTHIRGDLEGLVRQKLWNIVAIVAPNTVLVDRTAFEGKPASDGSVFLVGASNREVELPGVTLKIRKGPLLLEHAYPMRPGLHNSTHARMLVENMTPSRARSGVSRTVSRDTIEASLLQRFRVNGEDGLNILRDQIKAAGKALDLEANASDLDGIIGTILGTHEVELTSPVVISHTAGLPYDNKRIDLFNNLHDVLRRRAPAAPRLAKLDDQGLINTAFFEAYFSNFIEGTEFEVEEAEAIIFGSQVPPDRPADAHDIKGTYDIVSDPVEMAQVPDDFEEFLAILKRRHAHMMAGRPETNPGEFKLKANRAGSTTFVRPEEVLGTLKHGFEIYSRLDAPLDRAMFMMFLIAEVHPFSDGNGRSARIMMNAELVFANESRIIIPTVYRSDYLAGLSLMSNHGNPSTLIKTLEFGQRYVHSFDWSDFRSTYSVLRKTNAFIRPEKGDEHAIRLRLPNAADFAPDDDNDGGDGAGGGMSGGNGNARSKNRAKPSPKKKGEGS
jgi:hypothetical protein